MKEEDSPALTPVSTKISGLRARTRRYKKNPAFSCDCLFNRPAGFSFENFKLLFTSGYLALRYEFSHGIYKDPQ